VYDSPSTNGDRPVAVYYFPVEIEVRSVPVVELREVPVYVQDDTQQLIDEAFRAFAAALERA
jgi:hypothetical protein